MKTLILFLLLSATSLYSQTYQVRDTLGDRSEISIGDKYYYHTEIYEITHVEKDSAGAFYYLSNGSIVGEDKDWIMESINGEIREYFKLGEMKWLEKKVGDKMVGRAK